MDMGIIAAAKTRYRSKLLASRVVTMSNAQQLRDQAEYRKTRPGTKGVVEGYKPHLREARSSSARHGTTYLRRQSQGRRAFWSVCLSFLQQFDDAVECFTALLFCFVVLIF